MTIMTEDDEESATVDTYTIPPSAVAFVFLDDGSLEMVRSRGASEANDKRCDALYKLLTETNNDPVRILKVVSRGLAIEEWKVH